MSNYTKTTDFAAKDDLPSGDPSKVVQGSEFDVEFDNIVTAIASKINSSSSLVDLSALETTDGNVIVWDGANWKAEPGQITKKRQYLTGASQSLADDVPGNMAVGTLVEVTAYSSTSPKYPAVWQCTATDAALPSGAVAGDVTGDAAGCLYVLNSGTEYYKFEIAGSAEPRAFGAVGGSIDDAAAVQAAVDASYVVAIDDITYLVGSSIVCRDGTQINARGGTVKGSGSTFAGAALFVSGDNCVFKGLALDVNVVDNGTSVETGSGSRWGIYVADKSNVRVLDCKFSNYNLGVNVVTTTAGTVCEKVIIQGNDFEAGHSWDAGEADNFQMAIIVADLSYADVTTIDGWTTEAMQAEFLRCITIQGNTISEGQYGISIKRASNVTIAGNVIQSPSRGISLQQQCRNITVTGNSIHDPDSTGIHLARGADNIAITGNTITGTSALDNSGIQAYVGCRNITISDNVLDSKFDQWDGGPGMETRRPGFGIRLGKYVEKVVVSGNIIKGYQYGIYLQTDPFSATENAGTANEFLTGIRDVTLSDNMVIGAYFGSASSYKLEFLKSNSTGVLVSKVHSYEDVAAGAWDIENILIQGNLAENVGEAVGLAYTADGGTAATPPVFSDVTVTQNAGRDVSSSLTAVGIDASWPVLTYSNSWLDLISFTPSIGGTATDPTVTYTQQIGRYKREGKIVQFWIDVAASSVVGGSGNLVVKGLPFPATNATTITQLCSVMPSGITFPGSNTLMYAAVEKNTSFVRIFVGDAAGALGYPNVSIMASGTLRISGTYYVD